MTGVSKNRPTIFKETPTIDVSTAAGRQTSSKETIIVDASAVLCVLLGDENKPASIKKALRSYAQNELDLLAPLLLKSEVGNGLHSAVLQKRLAEETAAQLYTTFLQLPITYFSPINYSLILPLAIHKKLSFYDATYLHLAQQLKLPLLTLDSKLAKKLAIIDKQQTL